MAKLQQPAQMLPKEIYDDSTVLTHKPGASIHSSRVQGSHTADQGISIVFLNGLMTDKSTWLPVMAGVIKRCEAGGDGIPSMLAYDRYGQGLTEDRDPQDQGRETGHGHNVADAAVDLHHLIQQLMLDAGQRLLLVGNSIGCAIARLYAQKNPVAGVLLLDSIIANSNFNFWPDPDAPGFDKNQLPDDVGIDVLKAQRAKFRAIFDPANPNKEGLSRRDLADILPYSDRPALKGDSTGPWLTVVGHDFEAFADESLKTMGTPKSLSMQYSNPIWHEYNKGLAKLSDESFSKGPLQAPGCGHFIQRDNPDFVVDEILDLIDKIGKRS